MLVYGDLERWQSSRSLRAAIARRLDACMQQSPGLERHSQLVAAFIMAGELGQGLADAEFAKRGADDVSEQQQRANSLLLLLAQAVVSSWSSGFAGPLKLPQDWRALLNGLGSGQDIFTKHGEGYAHYALYPESYIEAARLSGLNERTVVIGVRSIGTGLAALVAAPMGTAAALTLRPVGDPFNRRVAIAPALARAILLDKTADFAIVDEGPGMSGSSLCGIADWLQDQGVAAKRLHFFPGHNGELGPQASAAHRQLWAGTQHHHVDLRRLLIDTPHQAHRLETWTSALLGGVDGPMVEISGGVWRELSNGRQCPWPPCDLALEKPKFIARSGGIPWLVKFVGLGEIGQRKLKTASLLADAGHGAAVAGLCHGFLVQRWLEATPLESARIDHERLINGIGNYLRFRVSHLVASNGGASLAALFAMAANNIGEALGGAASAHTSSLLGAPERFAALRHPVNTDNRLHCWEWLVTSDGSLIKTDALDHSAAHDLVGCQDVAWDIAGASVEFELSPTERAKLANHVWGKAITDEDIAFLNAMQLCYLGFQLGLWTNALTRSSGEETGRIRGALQRYASAVIMLISASHH